jgi:acetylglutamate kinase
MKIVIKFAGALLEDELALRGLARQVAALAREGHELLVVHGGGKHFTSTLARMGSKASSYPDFASPTAKRETLR